MYTHTYDWKRTTLGGERTKKKGHLLWFHDYWILSISHAVHLDDEVLLKATIKSFNALNLKSIVRLIQYGTVAQGIRFTCLHGRRVRGCGTGIVRYIEYIKKNHRFPIDTEREREVRSCAALFRCCCFFLGDLKSSRAGAARWGKIGFCADECGKSVGRRAGGTHYVWAPL